MALMFEDTKVRNGDKKQNRRKLISNAIKRSFGRLTGTYYSDLVNKYRIAETTDARYSSKNDNSGMYNSFNAVFGYNENDDNYKNLFEREYPEQRRVFRKLAKQPLILEIIETISKEAIIDSDDGELFASITLNKDIVAGLGLKPEFIESFQESVSKIYRKILKYLGFLDAELAQGKMEDYIVDGKLAYEIVYNAEDIRDATEIIEIIPLDPLSIKKEPQNNGVIHYVQTNEQGGGLHHERRRENIYLKKEVESGNKRILKEHNIIFIDFADAVSGIPKTSFIERLIKQYNIYRILEQSKIIWHVSNSVPKMKYTVPIQGQNQQEMEATLASAMHSFHENINFDTETGELEVNGSANLPFSTPLWAVSSDSGDFDVQTIDQNGQDLSDFDDLMFWIRRIYRTANVPINRYDLDGSETWIGSDPQSMTQQERRFQNMLKSLRKQFSELILKPLKYQLLLIDPSLALDEDLMDCITLEFQKYEEFEKKLKQEKFSNSIDLIERAKNSMVTTDSEGNEHKYFSDQFLVEEYLELTPKQIARNKMLREKEIAEIEARKSENDDEDKFESIKKQVQTLTNLFESYLRDNGKN